jgi:putative glutamine amidotransferase
MSEPGVVGRPIVGVVSDQVDVDGVNTNMVRTRYLEAMVLTAGVTPVLLATNLANSDVESLIGEHLDGVLLTGSASNVQPSRYSQPTLFDAKLLDGGRDDLSFAAIRAAVRHGKPLLGICRGLQEVNVAFGGTLHQDLTNVPDTICHHEDLSRPRDEQYLPSHSISLAQSGMLRKILQQSESSLIEVNSLHQQGIDTLGAGLIAEAVAPDGLIEAISVRDAKTPMLAVQWHLEWFHDTDPVSRSILRAFGGFCRQSRQCTESMTAAA